MTETGAPSGAPDGAVPCEICGRKRADWSDDNQQAGACWRSADRPGWEIQAEDERECYRLGYEREKARADAADRQLEDCANGHRSLLEQRARIQGLEKALRAAYVCHNAHCDNLKCDAGPVIVRALASAASAPKAPPSDPSDAAQEMTQEAAARRTLITSPHSAELDRLARLAVHRKEEEDRKLAAMTPEERDRYIEEWAALVAPGMVADGCAIDRALASEQPRAAPTSPSSLKGET